MNLDRSFEEAFEVTLTPLFPNVSCMCTQVWVSVITGNQITDLLREVPYNQVRIYFEKSISVALEKELTILNPSTCNIKCNKRSNITSLKEFKKTFWSMNPIYSRCVKRIPLITSGLTRQRVYKGEMILPARSKLVDYHWIQTALRAKKKKKRTNRRRRR